MGPCVLPTAQQEVNAGSRRTQFDENLSVDSDRSSVDSNRSAE